MSKQETIARAEYSVAAAAGAAGGVIAGAAAVNNKLASDVYPSTVHLAEDIALRVYTQPGKSDVYYGPTDFSLPHMASHSIVGNIGAHVEVSQFNTRLNPHGLSELIGLVNNLPAVDDQIKHALIERTVTGAGIGALAGGLAGAWLIGWLRQPQPIARLRELPSRLVSKHGWFKPATIGMAVLAIGGCEADQSGLISGSQSAGPPPVPIASIIPMANKVPALRDATVNSTGAFLARYMTRAAELYIGAVGRSWQSGAANFNKNFFSSGESRLVNKFRLNPNIVGILDIADMHCNYASDQYFFPAVLKELKPDVVSITGDTYTNSGTMPYEEGCAIDFVKDVQARAKADGSPIPVINVNGNHDPDKSMPGTITLDSPDNYSATVDSITFVGIGSWPRTTWSNWPSSPKVWNQMLIKEGKVLDQRACQITSQGEAPVVEVDEPLIAVQTMKDGCASLVNVAETHHEEPIKRYVSNGGASGLWHMAGTATGANIGLTIEETQQKPATGTMEYFNKKTRQFVGFITFTLSTYNTVSFDNQAVPGYAPKNLYDFNNIPSSSGS